MTKKEMPEYERTDEVLEFIEDYIAEYEISPSMREIGDACEISSTSVVKYHLDKLEKYGFIKRNKKLARTIRINKKK
jgi:repressor LexA